MAESSDDTWRVAEGNHDRHQIIIRRNDSAGTPTNQQKFPYRVGIAIPCNQPQKDGLPGKEDIQPLTRMEDLIADYFSSKDLGVLCLVISTLGMREFISYSFTDEVSDLTDSLSMHFPSYKVQHYAEQDSDWSVYEEWNF